MAGEESGTVYNLLHNTRTFGTAPDAESGKLIIVPAEATEDYYGFAAKGRTGIPEASEKLVDICEYNLINFALGDTYTFSFWARGTVNVYSVFFYGQSGYVKAKPIASSQGISSHSFSDGLHRFSCSAEWTRYWVAWQLDDAGDVTIPKYILIRTDGNTVADAELYICGPMLVKGDTPAAWAPAEGEELAGGGRS